MLKQHLEISLMTPCIWLLSCQTWQEPDKLPLVSDDEEHEPVPGKRAGGRWRQLWEPCTTSDRGSSPRKTDDVKFWNDNGNGLFSSPTC